jgi:hypothetical protein
LLRDLREAATDAAVAAKIEILEKRTVLGHSSYLIIPGDLFAEVPQIDSPGKFTRLGSEFIARYHSAIGDEQFHAYYCEVDPESYRIPRNLQQSRLPLDFFYVGVLHDEAQAPRDAAALAAGLDYGMFCLAGMPDSDLNMVRLYLLDPERTPEEFKEVEHHASEMLLRAKPLASLMS